MYEQHKKKYQHAGKCYDQQNLKDILDDVMVSTPEEVTDDSPNVPVTSEPVKKPSARKSLCLSANILNDKKKTEKLRIGAAKYRLRSMKVGNSLWNNLKKRKVHSKINVQIKRNLYAWITRHTQAVQ